MTPVWRRHWSPGETAILVLVAAVAFSVASFATARATAPEAGRVLPAACEEAVRDAADGQGAMHDAALLLSAATDPDDPDGSLERLIDLHSGFVAIGDRLNSVDLAHSFSECLDR